MLSNRPTLKNLKDEEARQVLDEILKRHPQLLPEAEEIAKEIAGKVDFEEIAEEIYLDLSLLDLDDLNARAGPSRHGYTDPDEAAYELVEEKIEPYLEDMKKRLEAGLLQVSMSTCQGILLGLYRFAVDEPTEFTDWVGDGALSLAGETLEKWLNLAQKKSKVLPLFPGEFLNDFLPEWAKELKKICSP